MNGIDQHHLIAWLVIGVVAGALAGRVVEGRGFGILGDLVVGIVGAFVGGIGLHYYRGEDVANGLLEECVVAFLGACVLLAVIRMLGGGRRRRRLAL